MGPVSIEECKYYPCHAVEPGTQFDCQFCYCPLYELDCGGECVILPNGVKDCTYCVRPHLPEKRQEIIDTLIRLRKAPQQECQCS